MVESWGAYRSRTGIFGFGPHRPFADQWKAVLQLAGIIDKAAKIDGDLHWHDLRRECGSRIAERGVDIMKVKELLGHATITMTQRYFATTTEAVGEAMRNAMGWKRETA